MNVPMRSIGTVLASGIIGYCAWNESVATLLFLPAIALIWSTSTSRLTAFSALLFYYAGSARGLLHGAGMFYAEGDAPSWSIGFALWLASSALLASVWALAWARNHQPLRLLVILAILSVPPFGIIGWANPLTAAGALYPGTGWFGLSALLCLLCVLTMRHQRGLALVLCTVTSLVVNIGYTPADTSAIGWTGLDTHLGSGNGTGKEFARLQRLQAVVKKSSGATPPGAVLVFPELVGGDWLDNETWWDDIDRSLREKRQSAFIGIHRRSPAGEYINSLVGIGAEHGVELVDRMPIPIAMWSPWTKDGAVAFWSHAGVTRVGGKAIGHLICYEQLLMWPVLVTAAGNPDLIVAASNVWWARATSIPKIQRQTVSAWARLFGKPVVFASNQ